VDRYVTIIAEGGVEGKRIRRRSGDIDQTGIPFSARARRRLKAKQPGTYGVR
jgi:hypothetical protein